MSAREPGDDGDQDKVNNNWLRSIPRRIRKLVSTRPSRMLPARAQHPLDAIDLKRSSLSDMPIEGDLDDGDDANLYLMVDYLGNDEEIAMIRACSQMSK